MASLNIARILFIIKLNYQIIIIIIIHYYCIIKCTWPCRGLYQLLSCPNMLLLLQSTCV